MLTDMLNITIVLDGMATAIANNEAGASRKVCCGTMKTTNNKINIT